MKNTFVALSAICVMMMTSSSFAQDKPTPEMMKAMKEYGSPNEHHKVLEKMAGKWKYTTKSWMSADGKPNESIGTSNMKMIYGGRFLQYDVKGKMMGQNFEGMGVIGFDNVKKKYDTFWFSNMATGMTKGEATFDDATSMLKESGMFTCPMHDQPVAYHSEWKMQDHDHMMMTMWGPDKDNKDYKMMEISFSR